MRRTAEPVTELDSLSRVRPGQRHRGDARVDAATRSVEHVGDARVGGPVSSVLVCRPIAGLSAGRVRVLADADWCGRGPGRSPPLPQKRT